MSKRVELRKALRSKKSKQSKTKERDKLKKGQAGVHTFTSPTGTRIRATASRAEAKYEKDVLDKRAQKMSSTLWTPKNWLARKEEGKHGTRGAPSTEKRFHAPMKMKKISHGNILGKSPPRRPRNPGKIIKHFK
tara:strand:+ start:819 stop:1220 length:402 start_codon:yes stop_codon:yes gene_type:complete